MQFVANHLTKHHLVHAPHRWFLAFLLSPIHALEVHYQRRYHLQFDHARKLFIFDMLLLSSIFIIGGIAASLHWYDPTVTKQVDLAIEANSQTAEARVRSGELITLKISYQNNSPEVLADSSVHLKLPPGFILRAAPATFVTSTNSITINELKPRDSGELIFTGQFWGEPGKNFPATADLVYRQQKTNRYEIKTAGILTTPADSVLQLTAIFPETIYATGSWEIPVTIKNTSAETINEVYIPFPSVPGLLFSWKETGVVKKPLYFQSLAANETALGTLRVTSKLATNVTQIKLPIIPQIKINNIFFNQKTTESNISVLHPGLQITSNWSTDTAQPGEQTKLTLQIKNTGGTDFTDLNLIIPLPRNLINNSATAKANGALLKGNTLYLSSREFPTLKSLTRNQVHEIPLSITIANQPSGSSEFSLPLSVTATIPNHSEKFAVTANTPTIKLGTFIALTAEAHYYSPEGDQIGRGPLPPKVGKETKYWALLALTNGTSDVSTVIVSATLAPGVTWTGKTSVTRGREPVYNPTTRTLTWASSVVPANETVSIDFELGISPTEAQRGTIPQLLTAIRATALDPKTNKTLSANAGSLNASLPTDTIGKQKGVRVE